MSNSRRPNRLINEKSPYLLQHAHNPVDWYPWGDEAFAKAQSEDKPLLVSIGYSTCHWCHVMERESFEDEQVGEILNQYFVAIKVDREERPDIDHIYMAACQALTGQGGWPLTVIMTPDKKPFFAGTYFPKESHYGRPGFIELLLSVKDEWTKNKTNLTDIGEKLTAALQKQKAPAAGQITEEDFHLAFQHFSSNFDSNYGGFGTAPKFPTPHNLMFLLRYYQRYRAPRSLAMVEKTLRAMYQGGIYDHIGYGFSRYSTDREWLVPHFEKMLYDNALLAIAYLETYQVTNNALYSQVAENIFQYVLRDMTDPAGGFYSAEDADSEGEEGKFYLWNQAEVAAVLGEENGKTFSHRYDITTLGNFEGKSIPNLINQEFEPNGNPSQWDNWRQKLFQAREGRIHPLKDDKILTAWNGLMIAALAKGSQVLQNQTYQLAAIKSADFIWQHLRDKRGRLLARHRQGESAFNAYLDDYAFLAWGLLELYQATFDSIYLDRALTLTKEMIQLFWDEKNSGFFFSGNDNETLITQSKEIYDGAIPAGNSVAAMILIKLARLTDDANLQQYAEKQLSAFASEVTHYLPGHSFFLLASMLQDKHPVNKQGTAYICQNFACQPPLSTPEDLWHALQKQ